MPRRYPDFRKRPRWDATSARKWQNMADDLDTLMKIKGGPGINVSVRKHVGVTISAQQQKKERREITAAGAIVQQFMARRHWADVVQCVSWEDGEAGTESVWIAKPYLLRRSPFDILLGAPPRRGITYTYSSDSQRQATRPLTGEQEDQVIVPAYEASIVRPSDLLYAIGPIVGGIDKVMIPDGAPEGTVIEWLELAGIRAWARVRANASRV